MQFAPNPIHYPGLSNWYAIAILKDWEGIGVAAMTLSPDTMLTEPLFEDYQSTRVEAIAIQI
jgi:hypothetical protein